MYVNTCVVYVHTYIYIDSIYKYMYIYIHIYIYVKVQKSRSVQMLHFLSVLLYSHVPGRNDWWSPSGYADARAGRHVSLTFCTGALTRWPGGFFWKMKELIASVG